MLILAESIALAALVQDTNGRIVFEQQLPALPPGLLIE